MSLVKGSTIHIWPPVGKSIFYLKDEESGRI